jgi:hypothetical protein
VVAVPMSFSTLIFPPKQARTRIKSAIRRILTSLAWQVTGPNRSGDARRNVSERRAFRRRAGS